MLANGHDTPSPAGSLREWHDLRQDALVLFVVLTIGLGFAYFLYLIAFLYRLEPAAAVIPVALILAGTLALGLVKIRPAWAYYGFPIALLIVVLTFAGRPEYPFASFFIIPIILVVGVIGSQTWMVIFSVLCCGALAAFSWSAWGEIIPLYRTAILLVALSATVSWVGSRNLMTSLSWTTASQQRAMRHVEELRQRRAELRRLTDMLSRNQERLHYLNLRLEEAKAAAEEAYRMKQRFAANISHELRTPLNLIVGFSEMMITAPESYGAVILPAPYRGDVLAIYRSAQHLSELIDDVLDLAQIETGEMPVSREPADLCEIVREAAEMVGDLIRARGLDMQLSLPERSIILDMDTVRVRQVLLNLLANSTRFTEKGWIRISADAQDGRALVAVQDTGSGIDPGKLFRAFEEFSMLDDEHAGEGSGLGLAISKKIVELHGGAMWLDSQLGLGTTVSFTLPLREDTSSAPARLVAGGRRRPSPDKPAVLVLHDDVRATAALARYIEGYAFVLAPTLAQAVEEADALLPVALVADASWAPRWEEVEAAMQGTSTRPWVLCPLPGTGSLRDALGVQGFLPKPVRQPDLLSALESLPREPEKVLVVDDEAHMVRLFGRMLRVLKPHLQVLEAFGGREALEVVRAERPDLVLLDLFMPDGNGYDVITALRADPDLENVQVIVVTVRGVAEQEVRPLGNEIRCGRGVGFSLTETISVLQTLLPAVTRPVLAGPANGEPSSAVRSD